MSGTDGGRTRRDALRFSVTAPANLLLMGEYAVLEEGGLGVAIAPDVRAGGTCTMTTEPPSTTDRPTTGTPRSDSRASRIRVVGELPNGAVGWPRAGGGPDGRTGPGKGAGRASVSARGDLLRLACEHLNATCGDNRSGNLSAEMRLDSSAFFTANGRKRGYGSSAAIVVVLTALWQRAVAGDPERYVPVAETVFEKALAAHRAGQGGAGSGYDVACSAFGGTILFSGGALPGVRPVSLPWLPPVRIIHGAEAVNTVSSVGAYREWKAANPAAARRFLEESNRLVSDFVQETGWESAAEIMREYRRLARELGASIGVDATVAAPWWAAEGGVVVKAVGAGNELAVAIGRMNADGREAGEVPAPTGVSEHGLVWA